MNTTTVSNSFNIPENNVEGLREKLAKLSRRATKLGLAPVAMTVGAFTDVPQTKDGKPTGEVVRYFAVEVTGERPMLSGWEFVATLVPVEDEVMIRSAKGDEVPHRFRNHATVGDCEHCRLSRARLETFVLRNESGEFKQVGRNCLADFLGGVDPKAIAAMASILWSAMEEAETACSGGVGGGGDYRFSTSAFLAHVALCVRKEGWLSRSKAREINEALLG